MKYLLWILISAPALAQHSMQPAKESTTDLRNHSQIFSIEQVADQKTYRLERSPNDSTFLRLTHKGEDTLRKIDNREAQKLDRDFAGRFLKVQYELPSGEGDCKVTLRLNMKGEEQEVCQKDEKKTQEIEVFVESLSSRF